MSSLNKSTTLSVSINRPPEEVYEFASNPENMSQWATAFVRSVRREENQWVLETLDGPMRICFVPRNDFGVLDHVVRLPGGAEVTNPMRVVRNGAGSEVLFTLFQLPGMSDDQFVKDAGMVERDLRMLKNILEK